MLMSLLIFNGNDANNACIYVVSPLPQRTLSSSFFETIWQNAETKEWRGIKAPGSWNQKSAVTRSGLLSSGKRLDEG